MDDKKMFELKDEQLKVVSGGVERGAVSVPFNRRCAANPRHVYFAARPDDVCPVCGEKEYTLFVGD